jgi:hypothetical protein
MLNLLVVIQILAVNICQTDHVSGKTVEGMAIIPQNLGALVTKYIILSFTNVVKWKVSKKARKDFHPSLYEWRTGVCLSVCLSVCPSEKVE